MRLASALGHLLLDLPLDRPFGTVSSPWAHWPSVARAKAFGAWLLMPSPAVRALAVKHGEPVDLARAVMERFGTTPTLTAWHLYNLRLIDDDDRVPIHKLEE